ncbi:ISL3 family transposase [Streptomyces sp. NPDC090075]|uniref:ISL3 family transposase n=1 Tax=Streptomyces sp. NPDC090075 TaxID=3365937 RepID=UPI00380F33ED
MTVLVMQADSPLWDSLVFDGIDDVEVESVSAVFDTVNLSARGRARGTSCPDCGHFATRVHGSYQRRLKDLPIGGPNVAILLTVRRFICKAADCSRRTFTEPFPQLTAPYARCTARLNHALENIGLALAGRAGARLATQLGVNAGRMTLLRRVMALPDPQADTPRVVGVDDFATKRGHTYATVITDGVCHRPIDVLPGREAEPLAAWLRAHPGIEVICRDRAGAYAEGAALGAPHAVQVADRFHLLQNLGQAVEKYVGTHRDCLRSLPQSEIDCDSGPVPPTLPTGRRAERMRAHHALVQGLLREGMGLRAIARHLGWGRHTVQRYARATRWQDMVIGHGTRTNHLDIHQLALQRRIDETDGQITIWRLHEEPISGHSEEAQ